MKESVFEKGNTYELENSVEYSAGSIVSKIVAKNDAGNITLFAFDKGQSLSEHTAPFDAIVQIVEGKAKIIIAEQAHTVSKGEFIIMPANIPHALEAEEEFKMLLTMLKS